MTVGTVVIELDSLHSLGISGSWGVGVKQKLRVTDQDVVMDSRAEAIQSSNVKKHNQVNFEDLIDFIERFMNQA